MAIPYIFEADFDTGAIEFDSEDADTDGIMSLKSYKQLASLPFSTAAPFRGAYALAAELAGGTNDATVTEAAINAGNGVTTWFRIPLWFAPNFTGTANDTINLFEAVDTCGTATATLGCRIVASTNVINLGIGQTAPTSWGAEAIERGYWYTAEVRAVIDTGGSGTIDLWLTREDKPFTSTVHATQVGSLTNTAVTDGRLGVQDHLGTTTGTILFGGLVQDDAQLYPQPRYPRQRLFTKSGHMFVGPGTIERAQLLLDGDGNESMQLWDTDSADTNTQQGFVAELAASEQTEIGPLTFNKGCYVVIGGTTSKGIVHLGGNNARDREAGPRFYNTANVRRLGRLAV